MLSNPGMNAFIPYHYLGDTRMQKMNQIYQSTTDTKNPYISTL